MKSIIINGILILCTFSVNSVQARYSHESDETINKYCAKVAKIDYPSDAGDSQQFKIFYDCVNKQKGNY